MYRMDGSIVAGGPVPPSHHHDEWLWWESTAVAGVG